MRRKGLHDWDTLIAFWSRPWAPTAEKVEETLVKWEIVNIDRTEIDIGRGASSGRRKGRVYGVHGAMCASRPAGKQTIVCFGFQAKFFGIWVAFNPS